GRSFSSFGSGVRPPAGGSGSTPRRRLLSSPLSGVPLMIGSRITRSQRGLWTATLEEPARPGDRRSKPLRQHIIRSGRSLRSGPFRARPNGNRSTLQVDGFNQIGDGLVLLLAGQDAVNRLAGLALGVAHGYQSRVGIANDVGLGVLRRTIGSGRGGPP